MIVDYDLLFIRNIIAAVKADHNGYIFYETVWWTIFSMVFRAYAHYYLTLKVTDVL